MNTARPLHLFKGHTRSSSFHIFPLLTESSACSHTMGMASFIYEYRLSSPKAHLQVRRIQQLGLLPLFITLALMYATHPMTGPGLWTALGLCAGLEMILWGAYSLRTERTQLSSWGAYLIEMHDLWFPFFLFFAKYGFIAIGLSVLWIALTELGFPSTAWHHLAFTAYVILLPIGRFIRELAGTDPPPRLDITDNLCRMTTVILLAMVIAHVLSRAIISQSAPYGTDTDPLLLLVWILAILVIVSAMMVYLGRIIRRRRDYRLWSVSREPDHRPADEF